MKGTIVRPAPTYKLELGEEEFEYLHKMLGRSNDHTTPGPSLWAEFNMLVNRGKVG